MKIAKAIWIYLKLFVEYTLILKLLWLSPFLLLVGMGTLLFNIGLLEDDGMIYYLFFLSSFLLLFIYFYFKKRKNLNVFRYTKLNTLPLSKKDFFVSLLILGIYTGYVYVLNTDYVIQSLNLISYDRLGLYGIIAMFLWVMWEEVCARGVILTKLTQKIGFNAANILTAVIFAAQHYFIAGGNPGEAGLLFTSTSFTIVSVIIRIFLGYMAGVILRTSNSVWFSVLLHWIHNIVPRI